MRKGPGTGRAALAVLVETWGRIVLCKTVPVGVHVGAARLHNQADPKGPEGWCWVVCTAVGCRIHRRCGSKPNHQAVLHFRPSCVLAHQATASLLPPVPALHHTPHHTSAADTAKVQTRPAHYNIMDQQAFDSDFSNAVLTGHSAANQADAAAAAMAATQAAMASAEGTFGGRSHASIIVATNAAASMAGVLGIRAGPSGGDSSGSGSFRHHGDDHEAALAAAAVAASSSDQEGLRRSGVKVLTNAWRQKRSQVIGLGDAWGPHIGDMSALA